RCLLLMSPPQLLCPSFPTRRSSDLAFFWFRFRVFWFSLFLLFLLLLGLLLFPKLSLFYNRQGAFLILANLFNFFCLLSALFNLLDRKSTRLNSIHMKISYAVFSLKK